jgi:hypothetical protein
MSSLIIWESFLQVKFFNCDVHNSYSESTQAKFRNYYILLNFQVISLVGCAEIFFNVSFFSPLLCF